MYPFLINVFQEFYLLHIYNLLALVIIIMYALYMYVYTAYKVSVLYIGTYSVCLL